MKRVDRLEEKLAALSSAGLPEKLRDEAGTLLGLFGTVWREVDRGELGRKIKANQELAIKNGELHISASIAEVAPVTFDLGDVTVDEDLRAIIVVG